LQAETGLNTNLRGDLGAKNSATIGLTQGGIANRNAGTGMLNDADKVFTDDIDKDIAGNIARKSTGGLIASM
jgi:hypothetical protein